MQKGNSKSLLDFKFKYLPQLEVKMTEPQRNNTTTSVK